MSTLRRREDVEVSAILEELRAFGLVTDEELARRSSMTVFHHGDQAPRLEGSVTEPRRVDFGRPGERELTVTASIERYSIDTAHAAWFSIRDWARVVVSVYGALWARIADQRRIGRQRGPGERSPAPLPDWYELSHLVYEHGPEIGLDTRRAVYQYLPGADEPYLNVAEALHLRQPR